jgi:hypothetical protein
LKNLLRKLSNWKHWPFIPFYFPISFVWFWYIIKSRSVWFFSISNPRLTFGGFEGESKKEMYNYLSEEFYPPTIYISPQKSFQEVLSAVKENSFSFPFIVKPNIGMGGILFRKIDNEAHLKTYHQQIPVDYIIQQFVKYPMEICIFYYRIPGKKTGKISAFFLKKLPHITGDGISTIKELLKRYPSKIEEETRKLLPENLEKVLKKGEIFNLSFIGNRYHGSTFHDLSKFIDNDLLALFDGISLSNNFYYGRYDIKCLSIEDLKQGKNFSILEFNGAGSIPNHIYTEKYTLLEAYKEIIKHWKALYEVSYYNYKAGYSYWKFLKGYRFLRNAKKHIRFLKECDKRIILKNQPLVVSQ